MGDGQVVPVPGRRGRHIVANVAHTLSRSQGEGVHTVAHSRSEEGVVLCSLCSLCSMGGGQRVVDVSPNRPAWCHANLWNPPDWAGSVSTAEESRGEQRRGRTVKKSNFGMCILGTIVIKKSLPLNHIS